MKLILKTISLGALSLTALLYSSCANEESPPSTIIETFISIPDSIFESKLIDLGVDSDGAINHKILRSDAEQVTHLDLNLTENAGIISDLNGIEGFINLTFLSVTGQDIQDIDLSFNTKLDTLFLGGNLLTNIDIDKNTNLVLLDAKVNQLHTITGLSKAENLKKLNLSFNDFEEVSINNESVEDLFMTHNLLQSIDLESALSLKNIMLTTNELTTIDLGTNTQLETLMISDNNLSNINLGQNTKLSYLYISSNALTGLDVSNNQALTDLRADRNPGLTCIQIQRNQEIPSLSLSEYQELNDQCNQDG